MKYLKSIIFVMILIFGAGSCTKDFEDLNKSPNNPVDVPAINIFTHVIQESVDRQCGGWIQHTYLGCWCQQWCKVQYIDEDKYEPRDMSGDFDGPYIGELADLKIIIDKTTEEGDDLLKGAALVMQAWIYMHLTDIFGDIPYSEALQGFDAAGTITPLYDTQESIYMELLANLEEANQLLATSTVNFGSGDLLYGGDPVAWRKFANSLKLRLLNRCAGTPWTFIYDMIDPQADVTTNPGAAAYANADADITTILNNPAQYPIFTSNDDDARLVYPGLPYRNPIFNTLYARTDQGISETMVDWLLARNDPRIHIYAQPRPNSYTLDPEDFSTLTYTGFQNGRGILSAVFPEISLIGTAVAYTETAPTYVLTYDEIEFIQAEHYMRVGSEPTAQTHYETGIRASMERWGLSDGGTVSPTLKLGGTEIATLGVSYPVDFTAYLAGPLVAWSAAANDGEKFQRICEQRWAAIFGQGVQAWHEVRRTGFPARTYAFELEAANYPDMGMPVRVQYSLNEETYNADNLTASKADQQIEESNEGMFSTVGTESQMWWHTRKNPIPTETDVPL